MEFRITGDIRAIERHVNAMQRQQLPFATALALTRTAQFAQSKVREEMVRVFDRPTRFTLNATWVQRAEKDRLWAMIYIREHEKGRVAPIKFLQYQIYGGTRRLKSFERRLVAEGKMPPGHYAVPTALAPLDQHGNLPGREITKILSDLRAHFDPAQNLTDRSARRRLRSRTRRASFYFSTWPPNKRTQHLKPGIYLRTHFGFGTAIKPVLLFVRRVRYGRRLDFFRVVDGASRMRFPIEFAMAMRRALATAR